MMLPAFTSPPRLCHIDQRLSLELLTDAGPIIGTISAMAFDTLVCHAIWQDGRSAWTDTAAVRAVSEQCRDAGLALWLDLPAHTLNGASPAGGWQDRLCELAGLGITGFRVLQPQRLDAAAWSALAVALPGCRFAAWTPGLNPAQIQELGLAGFHAAFSSLPWWNLQDDWYAAEHERLHVIGHVIAPAADPGNVHGAPDDKARLVLALEHAAALGEGVFMPLPGDLAAFPDHRFAERIKDQNTALADRRAGRHSLSRLADGAGWNALLRTGATARTLVVMNTSQQGVTAHPDWPLLFARAGVPPASGLRPLPPGAVLTAPLDDASPVLTSTSTETGLQRAMQAPRIVIQEVTPNPGARHHLVKRVQGEPVDVSARVFMDGHDELGVSLAWRARDESEWRYVAMVAQGNDVWTATFTPWRLGRHEFTIVAWLDLFATFRKGLARKLEAGQNVCLEVAEGRHLAQMGGLADAGELDAAGLLADVTLEAMRKADLRAFEVRAEPPQALQVDRIAARYASWYEMFPRSQGAPGVHGALRDVIPRLAYVRAMGFDVLYFPPIHPIGHTNRKGRNNSLIAGAEDPGSPYAIGAGPGGHDSLHPDLGTFDDFCALIAAAREHNLEIALDFAIQCSPDHPWLREHPEWFDWRADGSIRYAENPPKKYEDIVNVDFYGSPPGHNDDGGSAALWCALRDIVLFWIGHGVRTFRVDNPHTKPLPFWEWMIAQVQARHPDAIFLAEAFTRPAMMHQLAAIGFSQSYTYFTWRNTGDELTSYMQEISQPPDADYFRPHFFVNTPDINPVFLQTSGRPGFLIRAALACTLSGLWGMYSGYEVCEAAAIPGKEEYLDSEKYELRWRDWNAPGNIRAQIAQLNQIRRANPALQGHSGTQLLPSSNPQVLFYSRATLQRDNILLIAISLDPHHAQESAVELPFWTFSLPDDGELAMEDLVHERPFVWRNKHQVLRLEPHQPYGIWRVHHRP